MNKNSLTPEENDRVLAARDEIDFTLSGIEVLAIYSLGQMHNKVVRMTDDFWGTTRTGLFHINHINGKTDFDFSKPDNWQTFELDSISFGLIVPNMFGAADTTTFESLFNIKEISLLKQ
jgi:hypothetical protein